MSLNMGGNGTNPNGTDLRGVYIQESAILGAVDMSRKDIFGKSYDLAIELEISTGFEWNKKFTIKGNFKYDSKNPKVIEGWGGAFVVRDLFKMLGCFEGLTPEEVKEKLDMFQTKRIPADFMAKLYRKNIYTLSYVYGFNEEKGKPKYSIWNQVGLDRDKLLEDFKASLAKGYPRNYDPEALDSRNTDFEYGANVRNGDTQSVGQSVTEDDDDDFSL